MRRFHNRRYTPVNGQDQSRRQGNATASAFALILIGGIFLLRNLDLLPMHSNWWALLLLVPLFFLGIRIRDLRTKHGSGIPPEARAPLTGFLSITLVMVIFLFDLDWGDVWPLFIILVGVSFLFGASTAKGGRTGQDPGGVPPGGVPPAGPVP